MAFKTYAQLAVQSDVQDADLLAAYRGTGPLKSVTAAVLVTYLGGKFLTPANNLSDVSSAATARTNLGVPATTRALNVSGLVTGGGDLSADRTFTVTAALAVDVRTGSDTSKALTAGALMGSSAFQTLTDASTITWDCNSGYNATVTLTASGHTIGAPTHLFDGLTVSLEIVQDATGSRTVSWNSIWDFGAASLPILQTGANKADRVFGQYNARTGKIEASFRKGA